MRSSTLFLAIVLLTPTPGLSQAAPANKISASKQPSAPSPQPKQRDDGERVFQQNCARCHNAPSAFSPRIAGTIVRHMRVRASFSKRDEESLLRFLNP